MTMSANSSLFLKDFNKLFSKEMSVFLQGSSSLIFFILKEKHQIVIKKDLFLKFSTIKGSYLCLFFNMVFLKISKNFSIEYSKQFLFLYHLKSFFLGNLNYLDFNSIKGFCNFLTNFSDDKSFVVLFFKFKNQYFDVVHLNLLNNKEMLLDFTFFFYQFLNLNLFFYFKFENFLSKNVNF